MTRRQCITLPAFAQAAARAQPRRTRPNILFVMTDQQRGDCTGAAGNRAIRTPNMDRIAAEGVNFSNAFSSTPTCTPARTALLTGLSPWHHGMLAMVRMADRYPLEKPRALRDGGYYTMAIGKNHFSPMRNGHGYHRMLLDEHCGCGNVHDPEMAAKRAAEDRSDYEAWFWSTAPTLDPHATLLGWNDYAAKSFALPEHLHPTVWTGQSAVRFIDQYKGDEPFFLKVSFIRPHSPYDPPSRFMKMYADAPLPEARAGKWASRFEQPNSDRPDIWRGKLDPAVIRRSRQGYYGCITQVDEQIGQIFGALERRGWYDETLIVFTSDHGDMTGDQNLWRKSYAYQPSTHVPMMMRWPTGLVSARRGQTMPQPVELRDILPTFLDAASVPATRPLDGRSLLELVRRNGAGWRDYVDLEHGICYSLDNQWNALTDGKTKYIYHARHGEEQLFDLEKDPGELNDLAGDATETARLRLWRSRMVEHLSERGAPYVVSGRLGTREKSPNTSPHFPA
ncbi:MAG: arylsulfatase [Bryobacteraceae bacterium]